MYEYELINNHYVVHIDGSKYLIDTGSPNSFWVSRPMRKVTIDGVDYHLNEKPANLKVKEAYDTIGACVDGFIGMDIISKTSLTIYKKGVLEFKALEIGGDEIKMSTNWPLVVKVGTSIGMGKMIIDTGAKYAYGMNPLFMLIPSYGRVNDYNPSMGKLTSNIYHTTIVVGTKRKTIDVCENSTVAKALYNMGALIIGSVTSLYDEACVLDTKKGKLILK